MGEDERRKVLVPGRRYRITLSDCCIEGTLEGVFLERITCKDEDGDVVYVDTYRFDFGTIGPDWGAWSTEEIEGQDLSSRVAAALAIDTS